MWIFCGEEWEADGHWNFDSSPSSRLRLAVLPVLKTDSRVIQIVHDDVPLGVSGGALDTTVTGKVTEFLDGELLRIDVGFPVYVDRFEFEFEFDTLLEGDIIRLSAHVAVAYGTDYAAWENMDQVRLKPRKAMKGQVLDDSFERIKWEETTLAEAKAWVELSGPCLIEADVVDSR